jgi:hypothetical protein
MSLGAAGATSDVGGGAERAAYPSSAFSVALIGLVRFGIGGRAVTSAVAFGGSTAGGALSAGLGTEAFGTAWALLLATGADVTVVGAEVFEWSPLYSIFCQHPVAVEMAHAATAKRINRK